MIKKVILWILVITCAGTIFYFSSQPARESDNTSEGFIVTLIKLFDVREAFSQSEIEEIAASLNGPIRTLAHFGIYAVLGFLIALLLNEYALIYPNTIFYSVLSSFLYACTDELHQNFVAGRSAQIEDIVTDTLGSLCGALFAIIVIVLVKNYKKNHTVN